MGEAEEEGKTKERTATTALKPTARRYQTCQQEIEQVQWDRVRRQDGAQDFAQEAQSRDSTTLNPEWVRAEDADEGDVEMVAAAKDASGWKGHQPPRHFLPLPM